MCNLDGSIQSGNSADELVLRACVDARAFGELYEKHFEMIYRFCCHRLFCKHVAQDVCSEVFLNVAGGMKSFRGKTQREFAGWLWTIAVNEVNGHLRQSTIRKQLLSEAAREIAERPKRLESGPEMWPELYQAMAKLSADHQTIITLRYFEGLEFEEIGRIVKGKEGAVRAQLHRAIVNLRKHYKFITGGELSYVQE